MLCLTTDNSADTLVKQFQSEVDQVGGDSQSPRRSSFDRLGMAPPGFPQKLTQEVIQASHPCKKMK